MRVRLSLWGPKSRTGSRYVGLFFTLLRSLENSGLGPKFPLKNRKSGSRLPENRPKNGLKRQNSDGLSSVHLLALEARRESIHSIGSGNAKKMLETLSRPHGEIDKHGRHKIY